MLGDSVVTKRSARSAVLVQPAFWTEKFKENEIKQTKQTCVMRFPQTLCPWPPFQTVHLHLTGIGH